MIKFNKSQAALEFLTTYGWAFLVIIIMIGTLAYFGILNPSKILPNRCSFGSEFQCIDYQISATANTLRLRLKNDVGEPISVTAITISSEGSTAFACPGPGNTPVLPYIWPTGTPTDFLFNTCNSAGAGFITGDKGKVLITVRYNTVASGSNYAKDVKGEILSTVI